jgi:hypothetical protein
LEFDVVDVNAVDDVVVVDVAAAAAAAAVVVVVVVVEEDIEFVVVVDDDDVAMDYERSKSTSNNRHIRRQAGPAAARYFCSRLSQCLL